MQRRDFIRVIGGAAVLAAGSGLAGCGEPVPDPTVAWVSPGSPERDIRRYSLAHALLAPNPHNRQPWLARLEADGALTLLIDRTRLLPATDPFSRQIVVGCGAFLELLAIAATLKGQVARITPFPEGEPGEQLDDRPFARVVFVAGAQPDPLFRNITRRRTSRDPFAEGRPVPAADLQAILAAAGGPGLRTGAVTSDPALARLRALTREAFHREVDTPAANQESIALMRIGAAEISRYRDGISLSGGGLEAMKAVGLLNPKALATPGSMAFKQARAFSDPLSASAAAFGWIISADNTRASQIAAGRAYARMTLEATARGLAMQPMSQALQEYPQMAPFKARMDALTGAAPGERLQMLARLGYAPDRPPSPRRGLHAVLTGAQI